MGLFYFPNAEKKNSRKLQCRKKKEKDPGTKENSVHTQSFLRTWKIRNMINIKTKKEKVMTVIVNDLRVVRLTNK